MQVSHTITPVFDEGNLVSAAGLAPMLALAESAGLHRKLARLSVDSPHVGVKAAGIVAGMLAGADSIDDLDVLRHGAMGAVFDGLRAPSTYGTFLRTFTHGHVQQLNRAGNTMLTALTTRLPTLLPAAAPQSLTFVDIDDTVRQVHGYAKQGARYGYTHRKGLNIRLATMCTGDSAPLIAGTSLRRGNINSVVGGAPLVTRAINTARAAGVRGQIMTRADSAYYSRKVVAAASADGNWFSITCRLHKSLRHTIASIDENAWQPIKYTNAVYDDDEQRWVSDAEVAEIPFTAFTGQRHRHRHRIDCRLIVRRVKGPGRARRCVHHPQGDHRRDHRARLSSRLGSGDHRLRGRRIHVLAPDHAPHPPG